MFACIAECTFPNLKITSLMTSCTTCSWTRMSRQIDRRKFNRCDRNTASRFIFLWVFTQTKRLLLEKNLSNFRSLDWYLFINHCLLISFLNAELLFSLDQDNVKYCNFNEILEKYSCIPNDIYRTEI